MNFSLGKKHENYVADQVDSGHFNNASEVVRDALRMHEQYQLKLSQLRRDVHGGVMSIKQGQSVFATKEDVKRLAMERIKGQ